jgi:NAD(P)-dependent dehydrogenase (short-subunit alcohol dehydrogenase family)
MNQMFDLTGRVAIVTGASRGLGRAISKGLANAGADIVAADILDVKTVVMEIEELERVALGIKVDVSNKKDVLTMVKKTLEKFNRINILVNNAGIFRMSPIEEMKEEDWQKVIDVNLKGQFLCSQEVGNQMIKHKSGKIINIASVAGEFGYAQSAAYNASKAGVISLTKTLAVEWGKYNIQTNAICPGVISTDMTQDFIKDENFLQMIKTRVPLARYGEPEDLVGAAVFLSSRASDYVSGHSLTVDGGWTAGL